MDNSTLSCPKRYSTSFYKNDQDKSVTNNSSAKSAIILLDFPILQKHKNFPFPYPECTFCGKSMEIYKVHRSFVVFRCRTCRTKDRVPFNLPEPVTLIPENFKYFRFPIFFVLKAFVWCI
jgi:hypothetical protein